MGHTLWVDVEGREKDDVPQDNSIMLRLESQLDHLATKLNVPKLSEFYDYSELESSYGDFDGDDDESEDEEPLVDDGKTEGLWFDPSQALESALAIYHLLEQHPEELGFEADPPRIHWPADLMEELRYCRTVLEKAVSKGQQFRFLIVP